MKKHPLKRVLAVLLAMTVVFASLPMLAGRLMEAIAGTTVSTFSDLKDRLADGTTDIELSDDITLEESIVVPNTCANINASGKTINTAGYTISTVSGSTLTLENVNIKGGTATVISNVAGSKMIIKNSNIRENYLSSGSVIDNSGTMVLDGVGVNENKISIAAINNSGTLYTNNVTVAGNVSNSSAADTGSIKSTGSAYLLNTTVVGNKARGIYSSGSVLKMVNDVIENNVADGGTKNDIVIPGTSGDNLLAYSVYDGMYANTIVTASAFQVSSSSTLFCDYDSNHFPLVYNNMVYLNFDFTNTGAVVCFDYSDFSDVKISYGPTTGVENTITTNPADIGHKVTSYQDKTDRGTAQLIGASYVNTSSYHKVTLGSSTNGSVTGIGLLGSVVKDGEGLEISATANGGYTFRHLWDMTSGESLSTSSSYTLSPTKDMIIGAEFAKEVTYNISLLLNGVAWPSQTVELYQYGVNQNVDFNYVSGKYEGTVFTGKYDVYVNGSDSKQDITVTEGSTTGTISYSSIEFLANGGTGTPPVELCVPKNTSVTLPSSGNLEKDEYNFTGWVKQGETTVYAAGSNFTVSSATKLYANWLSKFVTARALIKLDGTSNNGFNVTFKNKTSGTEYSASYTDGAYSVQVPNSTTDMYDVIVDGSVIDTMTCTGLNNLVYNYYSVTYHGNSNTNTAQSNVVGTALAGSSYILKTNVYEKTGFSFLGWNTQANGGGTTKNEGDTVIINGATDYYAKWNVNSYKVTFDVNGGSALSVSDSSRDLLFGSVYGTLPTTTKIGYNFVGWEYNDSIISATSAMNVASNHTVKAKWTPIIYSITIPTGSSLNYTVTPTNGSNTAAYNTDYKFTITPKTGYSVAHAIVTVKDTVGGGNSEVLTVNGGVYTIPSVTCDKTIEITGVTDTLPPTGEISVSTNKWTTFLNTITFGKFFKATQTVSITATDPSGVASVSYYLSDTSLSLTSVSALEDSQWIPIANGGTFTIDPDAKLIVYAKLVDTDDHVSYISTDGLVLDHTPPVILGVTDGETYTGTQTVKVTDDYLASVIVDDVSVVPDENDNIFIVGKSGEQSIIATDSAGNTTTVHITVDRDISVPDGDITKQVDVKSTAPDTLLKQNKEKLQEMLLTSEDLISVDCGEDINILVEVRGEDVVPQDDKDLISSEMADKDIINIFDISVFKEYLTRHTREKVTDTPENLTFVFSIPEEYLEIPEGKIRTFYLGRVHGDAVTLLEDIDSVSDTYTAETDKFSTYVLAYKDADAPTVTTTEAGDGTTTTAEALDGTTGADDSTTTTVAEGTNDTSSSVDESTTDGGKEVGSSGVITKDNAPILVTVIAVMTAGTATVVTDKKRRLAKKVNKDK